MARTRWRLAAALLAMTSAACVSTEAPTANPPGPGPVQPAEPAPMTPTSVPSSAPAAPARPVQRVPAVPTAPAPGQRPAPAPGPLGPPRPYPEGAIALPCTLRAELEPTIVKDELRLRFVLSNLASEPATITLRGVGPGGMVDVRGLPAGFDPMHRCQAGACIQPTSTATYTVPPHKTVTIGGTTLHAKGDACNPPLPMGSSFLYAAITPDPPRADTCTGAMIHIVRDPKTAALRRAGLLEPPVPATPPPPRPKPQPKQRPRPQPKPKTRAKPEDCPVCAFACPRGIPSRKVGPDGCPICGCERIDLSQ